jgi:hypothetical protein
MMPFDATPSYVPKGLNTQWSSVSSVFEENLWSRAAQKKLEELSKLPENWNSYGSQPIQPDAIEVTAKLLSDLVKLKMPEPQIFPVSGGGIQLEWENSKCELEIEILPNKSVEYLIVDEDGMMHEGQVPQYNLIEIACLTEWFKKEKQSIRDLSSVYVPTF